MQIVWILSFFILLFSQAIPAKNSVINEEESADEIYGLCGAPPPIEPIEVQFVKGPPSRYKAGEPEFVNMKIHVDYEDNVENLEMVDLKEQLKRSVEQSVDFYEKLLKVRSADRAETPKVMTESDTANEAIKGLYETYPADFYLNVDYGCERSCCDGTFTLAWATFKLVKNGALPDGTFHPWHMRPIYGTCYICQGEISGRPEDDQKILRTVKHEILHALGFGQVFIQKRLKEREIDWKVTEERSWKKKVAYYTGPHTRDAARAHFGCPDLDGAEVEDAGEEGTSYGHWDKRAFGPELMTGVISQKMYFSNITAAFLRDSGWYEVENSMIDHEAYWYGKKKSCEFAMKSCRSFIDYAEKDVALQKLHAPAMPYCSEKYIQAWVQQHHSEKKRGSPLTCSTDRSTLLQCSLTTETTEEKDGWKKSHYGYFSDKGEISNVHGKIEELDFCPVFVEIHYRSVCSNVYNQPEPKNNMNAMLYGDSSLCFEHGQHFVEVDCSTWRPISGAREAYMRYAGAGCYNHKCSNGRLMIRTFAAEDTEEIDLFEICKAPGEEILIRRKISIVLCVRGTIICPKYEDICEGKTPKPENPVIPKPVDQVIPKPVDPVIPKPVDRVIPKPVDQVIPKPVDQVPSSPVDKTTPSPVGKIPPTSSGSGNFPSLVIPITVILVHKCSFL